MLERIFIVFCQYFNFFRFSQALKYFLDCIVGRQMLHLLQEMKHSWSQGLEIVPTTWTKKITGVQIFLKTYRTGFPINVIVKRAGSLYCFGIQEDAQLIDFQRMWQFVLVQFSKYCTFVLMPAYNAHLNYSFISL